MNGVTGDRAAYGTFRRSDQITITSRNFLWNCRSGLSSCSPILEISWSIALSGVERRLSPPSARDGDTLESTLYRDLLILPGATLRRNFSACTPRRIRACARLHARTDGRRTIRGQDDGSLNGSVSRGDRPDVGLLSYVDLRTCLPIRSMRVLAFSVSASNLDVVDRSFSAAIGRHPRASRARCAGGGVDAVRPMGGRRRAGVDAAR